MSMLTAVILSFVLIAPPADTGSDFRTVSVYGGHVTLEVPVDWEEIPPDVLESHSLTMAETTGGLVTEVYQHGFRSSNPEVDFMLPECLIQIRESGRLSYRQLLDLPTVEEMRSTGKGAVFDHSGIAARRMELNEAFFDRGTFSLRLRNSLDISHEGEITVDSVAFLTERGLFTVHFYVRASDRDMMATLHARIIDSVRFDDELRYHPRLSDRLPSRTPLILLASALGITAAGIALHLIQRRHQQP